MEFNFKNAVYVISDSVAVLKQAVDDGAPIIQLRDKSNNHEVISKKAKELVAYKKEKPFLFILNDFPELAVEVGADGVHIGQDTDTLATRKLVGPNLIIGKSTHSLEQGEKAQSEEVDYISVGPVFSTPTKPGRPAVGLSYIREAAKKLTVPFVAIGGIDLSNVYDVLQAGAKTIGIVRAASQTKELITIMSDPLIISGKRLNSRLLLGTGKFKSKTEMRGAIEGSGAEIVTVALRRIDLKRNEEDLLSYIPKTITLMVNTSGARNAKEAVRIARLARETGCGNWIKVEVINDSKYLLPDNDETIKATELLAGEGFVVLPYMNPDLYVARELVKAGAAAVMPLGSLIGSNQGIKTKTMIEILIEEINEVPVIVDAGIGRPSQAAYAMEMGADAVLINTAIATAENPILIASAFAKSVEAGRLAYLANMAEESRLASASSPLEGLLRD